MLIITYWSIEFVISLLLLARGWIERLAFVVVKRIGLSIVRVRANVRELILARLRGLATGQSKSADQR